jgi:hypothetical protein
MMKMPPGRVGGSLRLATLGGAEEPDRPAEPASHSIFRTGLAPGLPWEKRGATHVVPRRGYLNHTAIMRLRMLYVETRPLVPPDPLFRPFFRRAQESIGYCQIPNFGRGRISALKARHSTAWGGSPMTGMKQSVGALKARHIIEAAYAAPLELQ